MKRLNPRPSKLTPKESDSMKLYKLLSKPELKPNSHRSKIRRKSVLLLSKSKLKSNPRHSLACHPPTYLIGKEKMYHPKFPLRGIKR